MNRTFLAGAGLSIAGIAGYALGVVVAYPGRAFAVTAVMIGLTLLAIARSTDAIEDGVDTDAGSRAGNRSSGNEGEAGA